jgi:serine/threonine protein kinase
VRSTLHANDTLHRDIKPSNVRVDRSGRTVLLDLPGDGDHRIERDDGIRNSTITYMAPEQATTNALTPAADCRHRRYFPRPLAASFSGPSVDIIRQKRTEEALSLHSLNPSSGRSASCAPI